MSQTYVEKKFSIYPYKILQEIHDKMSKILNILPNWRLVGGVVRDGIQYTSTTDIDISTTTLPDQVEALFPNNSAIGKRFGTIMVFRYPYQIEITTTRRDILPTGRHTDVLYTDNFYEDSCRRDFTFNGLYCDKDYIYDYHDGLSDLKNGIVRFIGNANERIQEDYLRIFRYVRFFARYDRTNKDIYEDVIVANLDGIKQLSTERIISELDKMLLYPQFVKGVQLLLKYQIFETIFKGKLHLLEDWSMFNREQIMAILVHTIPTIKDFVTRQTKKYIQILERYTISDLALIWHRSKSPVYAKFYIKYHLVTNTNIPNKVNYMKLLDQYWHTEDSYTHLEGEARGHAELLAKCQYIDQYL